MLASRPSATGANAITNNYGFTVTSADLTGPVDVRIKESTAVPLDTQGQVDMLKEMINLYLALKQRPNGPFLAAVAKMLVEKTGLHELTDALEAEAVFESEQQAQMQEQQTQANELAVGQKSTELQLKAQELATKQQKVESDSQLGLLEIITDIQTKLADLNQKIGTGKSEE